MTFFDYAENIEPVPEFGIRDDEEGKKALKALVLDKEPDSPIAAIPAKELPAFIDYNDKKHWNAIVLSDNRSDFHFIPVDNNIEYFDEKGNEKSQCDAMIYTGQTVVFIELKDQADSWFDDAVAQLKSTIAHFDDVDGLDKFRFKKAYACNKRRPCFNYQYKDRMQQFFRETGVSLHPEVMIKNVK